MSGETALLRPRLAQATLLLASMPTITVGATIAPILPSIQRGSSTVLNAAVLVGFVLTVHGMFIQLNSDSPARQRPSGGSSDYSGTTENIGEG